jgi:anhydro-N-acetylmuramic acid kinase
MYVVGLMSGTSADGVDAALCAIKGAPPDLHVHLIGGFSIDYPAPLREQILAAFSPQTGRVDSLCRLNFGLAETFADAVSYVIKQTGVLPDLVASHGQTVWHDVGPDGQVTSTLQLVEAAVIAERTGLTTLSNFRARDVAAGGQGAPLVAYVDVLLLRDVQHWRAAQNIGGIGNVTFVPPASAGQQTALLTFDTGPGNVLIDHAAHTLSGQAYDVDGALAQSGRVDKRWLSVLLGHPYFVRQPPKTTGRELFTPAFADALLSDAARLGLSAADTMATLTAFTASSIADQYRRFGPAALSEVIVSGGGTRNPALMAHLRQALAPAQVRLSDDIGLDSRYKEAIAFAVLGYESWHQRVGVMAGQTGARRPTVLGDITPGDNFVSLIQRTWGTA